MLIGIDLDHTIIDYGQAFRILAGEWGLIPIEFQGSKTVLRDYLKSKPGGHEDWMRLQGYVYGAGINYARLMQGFVEFVQRCREDCIPLVIVSHKTEFGHFDSDKINLREAAMLWMEKQGFFSRPLDFSRDNIFFEHTLESKIERIKSIECTHFIDDLEEVFGHATFPLKIKSYLLNAEKSLNNKKEFDRSCNWSELTKKFFRQCEMV